MACPVPTTGSAFLSGILAHIDCQAQTLGSSGYQALANPGSSASLILTALLTLFIAFFGIRMVLGHVPDTGEVVRASIKVGIVLLLATSWSAYRTIAYDTVLRGPAELVEAIGTPSALPGAEGGLVARLQAVDDAIMAFIVTGTGRFDLGVAAQSGSPPIPVERAAVSDDFAFGIGRIAYLAGTIGALGLVRLVGGILLALAPLFAGSLLFDATRGLFMGWLRMLVASALAAVAVTLVLAVQLSIIEPWLSDVLARRAAKIATPAAPLELLVLTLSFSVIQWAMVAAAVRVAFVTTSLTWLPKPFSTSEGTMNARNREVPVPRNADVDRGQTSRAYAIAEAVSATQRREVSASGSAASRIPNEILMTRTAGERGALQSQTIAPIGQSYRRTARRVSAAATSRSHRT